MTETKTILLIGRTGRGKSSLANVITGNIENNKFKESSGSASETKEIQTEKFRENNFEYLIIDTPGIGDTQLPTEKILDTIAEAVYLVRGGVSQVFFVTNGRFEQYEMATYNLLRKIIFDQDITNYTTVVRTRFEDFRKIKKCEKDVESMVKESGELAEIIESCKKRVIHVDNPSINIVKVDNESEEKRKEREEEIKSSKRSRDKSREKLLSNLKERCQEMPYKPPKLQELSDEIVEFMERKKKLEKELKNKSKKKIRKVRVKMINASRIKDAEEEKKDTPVESIGEKNKLALTVKKEEEQKNNNHNSEFKNKIDEEIKTLEDERKRLKKEIEEKESIIREKVFKHIFNNYDEIVNIPGGDIFISSIRGSDWEKISEEIVSKWLSQGLNHQQVQELTNTLKNDFGSNYISFCVWLDSKKMMAKEVLGKDIGELKDEYFHQLKKDKTELEMKLNLKNRQNSLLKTYEKEWREFFDFNKEQTKEILKEWNKNIELIRPEDAKFLNWYLNTKKLDLNWALENEEEFKYWRNDYQWFGVCGECQQTNTSKDWCQYCNAKHFQTEFPNWTSGNKEIDKFIQQCQLEATSAWSVLEWIPYEQFTNIEHVATGGFGKVEKAKWEKGSVWKWDSKEEKWKRSYEKSVALKTLSNSQTLDKDFLLELMLYKMFKNEVSNIVPCYGTSQDARRNYIMVMKLMEEGNLKEYLKKNYRELDLESKLRFLPQIIQGLKSIHRKGLVHKDFHSGNIIVDDYDECYITDLGLCRSVNETDDKVYGVMPYVAPEVLRGKTYTLKADIYSLGMIMYEVLTGLPPFYGEEHGTNLALTICQGVRPQFPTQVRYPQLLVDLIKRCWDSEIEQRPTAREISHIVNDWFDDSYLEIKEDTNFYRQVQEAEEYNKNLPEEVRYPNYQTRETVWSSKLINTQQITGILSIDERLETTQDLASCLININELELQSHQEIPPK